MKDVLPIALAAMQARPPPLGPVDPSRLSLDLVDQFRRLLGPEGCKVVAGVPGDARAVIREPATAAEELAAQLALQAVDRLMATVVEVRKGRSEVGSDAAEDGEVATDGAWEALHTVENGALQNVQAELVQWWEKEM